MDATTDSPSSSSSRVGLSDSFDANKYLTDVAVSDLSSDPRNLFIGGLNPKSTDESLKRHFQQWSEVVDFLVGKDSITRK